MKDFKAFMSLRSYQGKGKWSFAFQGLESSCRGHKTTSDPNMLEAKQVSFTDELREQNARTMMLLSCLGVRKEVEKLLLTI